MKLTDIVARSRRPEPWAEGDNIPWYDPDFSHRMLREHLSQEHDLASRRDVVIQSQVAWIHKTLLGGKPGIVTDLACGPGLYTGRMAELGHVCTGIDWSPASIAYARENGPASGEAPTYVLEDLRTAPIPPEQDLIMFLYGEFNVFRPADIAALLAKAYAALKPGGRLLLEPHTYEGVKRESEERGWWAVPKGLFSDRSHIGLEESFWDDAGQVKTTRYYIVDAESGEAVRYASSMQAYTNEQYTQILTDAGFSAILFRESLSEEHKQEGLQVIVAVKPG